MGFKKYEVFYTVVFMLVVSASSQAALTCNELLNTTETTEEAKRLTALEANLELFLEASGFYKSSQARMRDITTLFEAQSRGTTVEIKVFVGGHERIYYGRVSNISMDTEKKVTFELDGTKFRYVSSLEINTVEAFTEASDIIASLQGQTAIIEKVETLLKAQSEETPVSVKKNPNQYGEGQFSAKTDQVNEAIGFVSDVMTVNGQLIFKIGGQNFRQLTSESSVRLLDVAKISTDPTEIIELSNNPNLRMRGPKGQDLKTFLTNAIFGKQVAISSERNGLTNYHFGNASDISLILAHDFDINGFLVFTLNGERFSSLNDVDKIYYEGSEYFNELKDFTATEPGITDKDQLLEELLDVGSYIANAVQDSSDLVDLIIAAHYNLEVTISSIPMRRSLPHRSEPLKGKISNIRLSDDSTVLFEINGQTETFHRSDEVIISEQ